MTKRAHAELIHKWAEGAQIQFFGLNGWQDQDRPQWMPSLTYRVKPKEVRKVVMAEFFQEAGSHMAHFVNGVSAQVKNDTKEAITVSITSHKEV